MRDRKPFFDRSVYFVEERSPKQMCSATSFWNEQCRDSIILAIFSGGSATVGSCRCLLDSLLPKLFAVTFFCSCLTEPRRAGPWHARRAQQRSVLSMLACGSCPSDSLNIFSHRRSSTTALSSRWGSLLTFGHLCSSRRSAHGRVKIRSASSSSLIYCSIPLSRYKTCLSAVSDRNALRRV